MSEEKEQQTLLPLDATRVVTIKSKDRAYTYQLRRITQFDWLEYFNGIVHQTTQRGDDREQIFESETALLELVDRTLMTVSGYGDLSGVKDWKLALPIKHRIAVGIALRNVGSSPTKNEAPDLCDLVEAKLDATWASEGKTILYSGLVHRFRQPTIAQLKRFNFESARVKVSGSAENGITVYPARQAIAMKVYDELIESVDGYSVAGVPLDGIANIQREMDGAHKAAAALDLFQQDDDVSIQ